jgi:hypothetical protein
MNLKNTIQIAILKENYGKRKRAISDEEIALL